MTKIDDSIKLDKAERVVELAKQAAVAAKTNDTRTTFRIVKELKPQKQAQAQMVLEQKRDHGTVTAFRPHALAGTFCGQVRRSCVKS